MRRTLWSGLAAAALVAGAALGASPASAEVLEPTIREFDFAPNPVVFTATGGVAVSGTVRIEEPSGWELESAAAYDPSCWRYYATAPSWCPRLMLTDSSDKVLNVRTLRMSGTIPRHDQSGHAFGLNGRSYVPVVLEYTNGHIEYDYLHVTGATRASLTAPSSVQPASSLTLEVLVEYFEDRWTPYDAWGSLQFRPAGTDRWLDVGGASQYQSPGEGRSTFYVPAVSDSGDWRVLTWGSGGQVTSNAVHVEVEAAAAPSEPPPTTAPVVVAPSAPEGVRVKGRNGSAVLRWDPPLTSGGSPVDWYQVKRRGFTARVAPDRAKYVFDGLRNGRTYVVSVRAHTDAGYGPWSEALAVRPDVKKRVLVGTPGRDVFNLVRGPVRKDRVDAGAGRDVVRMKRDGVKDVIRCGAGKDLVVVRGKVEARDRYVGCERVVRR